MKKIPFIAQKNQQDCGLSCIAMLLAYRDKNISIEEIKEHFRVSNNGLNMANLNHILKYYGGDLISGKSKSVKNFLTPSIIHLTKGHFVVLEKVDNNYAYIVDPANGRKKYKILEIESLCSEYFIYVKAVDFQVKKKPINLKYMPFLIKCIPLILISLIIQLLTLQVPIFIKYVTDKFEHLNLFFLFSYILVLILIFLITNWLRGLLIIQLKNKIDYKIMRRFITNLINLPLTELFLRSKNDLTLRANANEVIKQILTNKVLILLLDSIFLVFYSYMLLHFSLKFGFIIIFLSVLVIFIFFISTTKLMELTNIHVLNKSELQVFYTELVNRLVDIKTENLENQYLSMWERYFHTQLRSFKNKEIFNNKLNTLINCYQFSIPLIISTFGIFQIKSGDLTLGSLLAINILGGMIITPVISISNVYSELIYIKRYISKVTDIINYPLPQKEKKILTKEDFDKPIKIKNVSFSYGTFENYSLKNINMEILPYQKVAIVGKAGSGKSTLLKIIAGLYKGYKGIVTINNKDISDHSYMKSTGIILQESKLFNTTIKENVSNKLSDEECMKLLKKLNFSININKLPQGIHTQINENAKNLSKDEIQKILLARSLANNPKLLLYDEATSALDKENQRVINKVIREKHITQIIVTQHFNTVLDADKIFVLDKGRIIEIGKPNSLLKKRKFFQKKIEGDI